MPGPERPSSVDPSVKVENREECLKQGAGSSNDMKVKRRNTGGAWKGLISNEAGGLRR